MATATITITDLPDGMVNVVLDFGEGVKIDDDLTPAQQTALNAVAIIHKQDTEEE